MKAGRVKLWGGSRGKLVLKANAPRCVIRLRMLMDVLLRRRRVVIGKSMLSAGRCTGACRQSTAAEPYSGLDKRLHGKSDARKITLHLTPLRNCRKESSNHSLGRR